MKHRACRALLCLVLAVSLLLPMTVGALADTTIGTDASRPEYFEALGGSGSYNPLKTPYHYDKTTGNVAYCLEHKKDSPSSSAAYTDFGPSALWGHNTVMGIQAIVDHGYPNSTGGLTEEQAHYATANAIRAWMKESADVGYNFMRVDEGHIRPLSGTAAQETWVFFLELLGYARAGATLGGTSGGMVRVCIPLTRSGRCRAINWSRASRFPAPTATPSAAAARRWILQATPAAQKIRSPRRSRC